MNVYEDLRQKFQSLSPTSKRDFIQSASKLEIKALYQIPELFLFDKQIIPNGNWKYCILRCGRRFGKSIAGSAWIASKVYNGAKSLGLCGPTYDDVAKVMVPNIQSWFPADSKPIYNNQQHTLTFPKYNAIIYCMTSDKEERGKSIEYLWCDEIGSWCDSIPEKVKERFQILDTACSVGNNPQTIITSTPKPFPLFFEWETKIKNNDPHYILLTGTMYDNPHLSEEYREKEKAKYGNTRLGRQELWGDLLEDVEGALFTYDMIDANRINSMSNIAPNFDIDDFDKIIIAIDPAITANENSDSTGIIIVGLYNGQCYVLADLSGTYTPNQWANKVNQAYKQYKANYIIVEVNQGGDLVRANLKSVNPFLPIKDVRATKGKLLRAEPIAALYEQNKVHHIGNFRQLEQQMTSFTGQAGNADDRVDSVVYAITALLLDFSYGHRGGTENIGMTY